MVDLTLDLELHVFLDLLTLLCYPNKVMHSSFEKYDDWES